jgi:hypothetical protein
MERTGVLQGKQTGCSLGNQDEGCDRIYWQEPWLEVATRLCRVDDGVSEELYKLETSDRVARLKSLGNAIVPQVAYEIIKAIMESQQ